MAFTAREKARIKHFLSYPDWVSLAQAIQLGYPAASQPLFLVEDAFQRMTPDAEETIRQDLCECEDTERQISEARGRMKATQIGNLKTNPRETRQLRGELQYWAIRLADDLGVVSDPFSQAFHQGLVGAGGGRNAAVIG